MDLTELTLLFPTSARKLVGNIIFGDYMSPKQRKSNAYIHIPAERLSQSWRCQA